jgi:hypothetical protein
MRRAAGWVADFARFWWDFIFGDDPWIAVGVAAALAVTWGLVQADSDAAWWFLPVAAVLVVAVSVRRANRRGS